MYSCLYDNEIERLDVFSSASASVLFEAAEKTKDGNGKGFDCCLMPQTQSMRA